MEVGKESVPFIFIGMFILIGNLFVCLLYHKHNVLHTTANRFVLSFAACDMMIAILFIPLYIFKSHLSSYIAALSSFGSILNLLALTYERYVAIFHALRYHEMLDNKKIRLLMVEIWFLTLVITLFPLPWELSLSPQAFLEWRKVYSGILTGLLTIIVSITTFVYVRIFKANRHHVKKDRMLVRLSDMQSSGNDRGKKTMESNGQCELKARGHTAAARQQEGPIDLSAITAKGDLGSKVIDQEKSHQDKSKYEDDYSKLASAGIQGAVIIQNNDNLDRKKPGGQDDATHSANISPSQAPVIKPKRKENGGSNPGVTKSSLMSLNLNTKFQTAKLILREVKAARIIAIIFTINCLCWLPIIVINFCDVISPTGVSTHISGSFITASLYLFLLNSMINPFIYALFKKDFRKVISRRLRMLRQGIA